MEIFLCGNSPLLLVMQEYQMIGAMDGVSCLGRDEGEYL